MSITTTCTCTHYPDGARLSDDACAAHPRGLLGRPAPRPAPTVNVVSLRRKVATLDRVVEQMQSKRDRLVAKIERATQ